MYNTKIKPNYGIDKTDYNIIPSRYNQLYDQNQNNLYDKATMLYNKSTVNHVKMYI